jgi:hypothetical protein
LGDSNAANIWKNRIVGYGQIDVEDALAHENNWRIHAMSQQEEMRGILETIGVIQNIIINKRTSDAWPVGDRGVETMIDGHMRIALAMRHGQQTLPVTYVDLDPGEEAIALATFDPIGALAGSSREQLDAVLREIETDNTDVQKLLGEVAERAGLYAAELGPEDDASLPTPLPPAEMEGWGEESRRVIIVFENEDQERECFGRLGIEPEPGRVVYKWAEMFDGE